MQLKAIKLFISLTILLLYCFIVAEQILAFLVTFYFYIVIWLQKQLFLLKTGKYLFSIIAFFAPHRSFAEENKIDLVERIYIWTSEDAGGIYRIGNKRISIPLPVIVHSKQTGWHVFYLQFRKIMEHTKASPSHQRQ